MELATATTAQKPLRVLIIDDNRSDRKVFRRFLRQDTRREYLIFESESGAESLELAKAMHPDCILLDYKLPDMNGLDLLPELKKNASLSLIPVIFATGIGTQQTAIEGFRRGAQEYIDKNGLTSETLMRTIDNALKHSHLPTRLESALRESEERFRLLIESVRDTAIYFLDAEGKVGFWNTSADRLFGYSADEIAGKPYSIFFPPEELESQTPQKTLSVAFEKGHHGGIQQRIRKDGSIFWADVFVSALKDETGKLRAYAEVTRDISDRIESEKKLRKTETRLKRLVYSNITGIVFWNSSGMVLDANGAFLRIIGRTREELEAGQINFFGVTAPELNDLTVKAMAQVADVGTCVPYETVFLKKDGTRTSVLVAGANLGDGSDEFVTFAIDISEQMQTRKKIEEAVKVRDEFLSIASHELKTPITSLRLQIQMTLRTLNKEKAKHNLPERLTQVLESSDLQIGRLVRLVDDLLDVARVNAGRMTFNYEFLDLSEEIRQIIERFQEQLDLANIKLTYHSEGPVEGYWDRIRIAQVFDNLISNAIKYGGKKPIDVYIRKQDGKAYVQVQDSGMGISVENQDKIFGRFERVISDENISGLGLGLYIVKNIVTAHRGEIRVESAVNHGAKFIVELPLDARMT